MQELAEHYGVAVLPARPGRPQDKAKVEVGVQVVERWILARLRHQRFFSLAELNRAIRRLAGGLNQRAFKKLPGCRASAFLPNSTHRHCAPCRRCAWCWRSFKPARVNIDYHVELRGPLLLGAPPALVGEAVELRITAGTVEVLHAAKRMAAHALNPRRRRHTTTPEHMPASHRAHLQWTPAKLIAWGERVGAATAGVVRWQMEHRQHPEQGYRSCLGLMRLGREYGHDRLEAACARAQSIRAPPTAASSILACGLDRQRPAGCGDGRPGADAAARERARAGLLPLMAGTTPVTTPPQHATTSEPNTEPPCSTNTPWTNCAPCAWTAWSPRSPTRPPTSPPSELPFEQRLALLVQREVDWRDGKRLAAAA
jgi:hypothetical protein